MTRTCRLQLQSLALCEAMRAHDASVLGYIDARSTGDDRRAASHGDDAARTRVEMLRELGALEAMCAELAAGPVAGWEIDEESARARTDGSMPFEARIEGSDLVVAWPEIQDHPQGFGEVTKRVPLEIVRRLMVGL